MLGANAVTVRIAISIWVLFASIALILLTERYAERAAGSPLAWWRRLAIPLPTALFLIANIDGIVSLRAYLDIHPFAVPARYSENQAWNTDRFFIAGLVAAALLPFLLTSRFSGLPILVWRVWSGHILWLFFALAPLLLVTGVPLRQ
jgi:hypothetical protein